MTNEELESRLREALREEPRGADTPCPSLDELLQYVKRTLLSEARARVDAHLADCDLCSEDVARLYRGWKDMEAAAASSQRSRWSVIWDFFRPPALRLGLAVAAVVLVLGLVMWKLHRAPRQDVVVRGDGKEREPAAPLVRHPVKDTQSSKPPPQPQTPSGEKNKPSPQLPPQQQPRPPRQEYVVRLSEVAKEFLAVAQTQREMRSSGQQAEAPLIALKPNLTIILSRTPELVAKVSRDITGPFTFQVDEVELMGQAFQDVEGKKDVAQTKDEPVDKPSITLTKPLERGKIYGWQVSVGGEKSDTAYFMVAEQSIGDAVERFEKKYAHTPLRLAKFYTAHGLYLDALDVLDRHLSQSPSDPEAQEMRRQIEGELKAKD